MRNDTPPPATGASEKEVLRGFLDYLRASAAAKLDGVPEPQVREPGVPSGTNLLGLIRHLTAVERFVFLGEDVGSWAATFRPRKQDSVDTVLTGYLAAIEQADAAIAACDDLDAPTERPPSRKAAPSMRWALTHMIEETGRHAGQLDILRELIDGRTGR